MRIGSSILLVLMTLFVSGQDSGLNMFDNSILHEVRVVINDGNYWTNLVSDYDVNYPNVPYTLAMVTIDGEEMDSIGVRRKRIFVILGF